MASLRNFLTESNPKIKELLRNRPHLSAIIILLLVNSLFFMIYSDPVYDLSDDNTIQAEEVQKILVDDDGSGYIIGYSQIYSQWSDSLIAPNGNTDIFILRFSGEVTLWTIFLGGSDRDIFADAFLDAEGNLIIAGKTFSEDFIAGSYTLTGTSDLIVSKILKNGTVSWTNVFGGKSTYLGEEGDAEGISTITIGNNDTIFLTGYTYNQQFLDREKVVFTRTHPKDHFVIKLDKEGNRIWETYEAATFGDSINSAWLYNDVLYTAGCLDVEFFQNFNDEIDPNYVFDLEKSLEVKDIAITVYDENGTVVIRKFLGGSAYDCATDIEIDINGNVFLVGATRSGDIPLLNAWDTTYGGGFLDGYLAQLTPDLEISWATYFGGNSLDGMNREEGQSKITLSHGFIYVTTTTFSSNFHTTDASSYSEGADIGVMKFSTTGELQWSTLIGGKRVDISNDIVRYQEKLILVGYSESFHPEDHGDQVLRFGLRVLLNTNGEDIIIDRLEDLL